MDLKLGGARTLIIPPNVELPKSGAKLPLRACDYYAVELSQFDGSPQVRALLAGQTPRCGVLGNDEVPDQWGNCFRDRSKSSDMYAEPLPTTTARFCLSPLTQPATPEDVAAGRAIFSLRDRPGLQVRVVELKPYPSIGRWKTLEKFRLREPVPIIPPGEERHFY